MRTTIDLPDDLHQELRRRAFEQHVSLSRVASELLRSGLAKDAPRIARDRRTGVATVQFGRGPILDVDIKAGDDEW